MAKYFLIAGAMAMLSGSSAGKYFRAVEDAAGSALADFDEETQFEKFRPDYRSKYKETKERLRTLHDQVIAKERKGAPIWCLEQIEDEAAHWLNDTALFERANERIDALTVELKRSTSREPEEPQGNDGNWGQCYTQWFLKLNATSEKIRELKNRGLVPEHRVTLLDRVNSPEKLQTYLRSVLVSDIAKTGINHAHELNEAISEFLRLIPNNRPLNYQYHPDLKATLLNFIDNEWQNSDSGWWGEWQRIGGEMIQDDNLSMTFHIVSYQDGEVNRWPQIVATMVRNGDRKYPYGWRTASGEISNHHMYDVARIYRLGWSHMGVKDKDQARRDLRRMLELSLNGSMLTDGSFKADRYTSLGQAHYFGVAFLHEIGFFSPKNRFWTDLKFSQADQVRERLMPHVFQLQGANRQEILEMLGQEYAG